MRLVGCGAVHVKELMGLMVIPVSVPEAAIA
jgi:hypothetical protein